MVPNPESQRPADWSRHFRRPIKVKRGPTLSTLVDVRKYLLELPESERELRHWQRAAHLLLNAAQGGDLRALENQIERATALGRSGW
jgi:hypothetical protein